MGLCLFCSSVLGSENKFCFEFEFEKFLKKKYVKIKVTSGNTKIKIVPSNKPPPKNCKPLVIWSLC